MDKPKLREILERLYTTGYSDGNGGQEDEEKEIAQAEAQIKEIYKEQYLGMLPEELEADDTGVNGHCSNYVNGFNSAIQEFKRRVGA
jgi:hypothetical protein